MIDGYFYNLQLKNRLKYPNIANKSTHLKVLVNSFGMLIFAVLINVTKMKSSLVMTPQKDENK